MGLAWPGVAQVLRLQRVVQWTDRATAQPRIRTEVAYAVTSLPPERGSAAALLGRWRAHWHIENRLHWVRDVTLGEDASAIHLGQAPLVVALLRTAVLALLPSAGAPSLAAAQRDLTLHPTAVLDLFRAIARALAARAHSAPAQPRLHATPATTLTLAARAG